VISETRPVHVDLIYADEEKSRMGCANSPNFRQWLILIDKETHHREPILAFIFLGLGE
jgi:hypothetical protein